MRTLPLALLLVACDRSPPDPPSPTEATAPGGPAPTSPAPAAPAAFALPSSAAALTPRLTVAGADLLYTWQERDDQPGAKVSFARWHDGAWSAPVALAGGPDVLANGADFPAVAAAADGTLYAHTLRRTANAYEPAFLRSTDAGATWAPIAAPFPAGLPGERGFVAYAAEPGGLRVYWLDGRDNPDEHAGTGSTALRTAVAGADGFGPEQVVDPRTCDCCPTDAVVAGGHAMVVYRDRSDGEQRDIAAVAGAGAPVPVGADGWVIDGCPVNGPAADAAPGDGPLAVAWYSAPDDHPVVRAAFSTDGGASFGPAITLAAEAAPGQGAGAAPGGATPLGRVDIALDADGTALVSWLERHGDEGRIQVRRVAADGRAGAPITVGTTTTTRAAGAPRLVRWGDTVVVTWAVPGEGNRAVRFAPALVPAG